MIEQWVQRYRSDHPAAAHWARGSQSVRHTIETQCRIFRMAEQIRVNHIETRVSGLFSMLQALDSVVDLETFENGRPSPQSAAAAGMVGYKMLFGKLATVQAPDWPEGFERAEEGEATLVRLRLQAEGFDPITIDALDPAGYLWALFEMENRLAACSEAARLGHPVLVPRCLAIIPGPARRPLPEESSTKPSPQLVDAQLVPS